MVDEWRNLNIGLDLVADKRKLTLYTMLMTHSSSPVVMDEKKEKLSQDSWREGETFLFPNPIYTFREMGRIILYRGRRDDTVFSLLLPRLPYFC